MPRIKINKDAFYHVMTRTAQAKLCLDDGLKEQIYSKILFFAQVYHITPVSIAVMSNHYHICLKVDMPEFNIQDIKKRFELLQTHRAYPRRWSEVMANRWHKRFSDLSKFMWDLNRDIAWSHNKMAKTWGHFWGAPFKSHLVEPGEHLLTVMKYIDLNPVRAGIVEKPEEYPFSSAGRLAHPSMGPSGVHLNLCNQLNMFPSEQQARIYLKMLNQMPKRKKNKPKREHIWDPSNWTMQCFGSYAFEKNIQNQLRHTSLVKKYAEIKTKSCRGSPA